MNRRKFVLGAGSIGAATIGGAALFSGSAAADTEISGEFSSPDDPFEESNNAGSFGTIEVHANNVELEYNGLDSEAEYAIVTLSASNSEVENGGENIGDDEYYLVDYAFPTELEGKEMGNSYIGGLNSVKTSTLKGDLLDQTPWEESDFEAGDGDTKETTVPLQLDVWVFFGDVADAGSVEESIDKDLTYDPEQAYNYTVGYSQEHLIGEGGKEHVNYVRDSQNAVINFEITNEPSGTATSAEAGATITPEE